MTLRDRAAGVGALADPTREALYGYVVSRREPVGREEAAAALGLPPHKVNFHLDRLVDAGLLEVEFRRLSGRGGPGAGRPSKLYRRSDRELAVSLPARQYDLVGSILASGIERAREDPTSSLDEALERAAADAGRAVGEDAAPGDLATFAEVLSGQGFEPRVEDDTVLLANCPFDSLAREHTDLVCGLNRSFVQGVADGVGCSGLAARLDPEAGLCCVKVSREP